MTIDHLIAWDVQTCHPGDSLNVAAQIMWERNCGCVPVVLQEDGAAKVVGTVTDRDICMAAYIQGRRLTDIKVENAMARGVHSCCFTDSIGTGLMILRQNQLHWLAVLDQKDHLIGMLSFADAAREAAPEHGRSTKEVTDADVTGSAQLHAEFEKSNSELQTAYEDLQTTNEELQTTNKELQSTIEELETTNEELQSSNEEMETMNAELQSCHEELQTTNDQLHSRDDELNRVNTFLESIVASMQTGVVVLDANLAVEIWNRKAEDLWGLRADEVRGQPFLSLDIGLPVAELVKPLQECLAGNSGPHRMVLDARNRRGRSIRCSVACVPLVGTGRQPTRGVILMMEPGDSGGSGAG